MLIMLTSDLIVYTLLLLTIYYYIGVKYQYIIIANLVNGIIWLLNDSLAVMQNSDIGSLLGFVIYLLIIFRGKKLLQKLFSIFNINGVDSRQSSVESYNISRPHETFQFNQTNPQSQGSYREQERYSSKQHSSSSLGSDFQKIQLNQIKRAKEMMKGSDSDTNDKSNIVNHKSSDHQ